MCFSLNAVILLMLLSMLAQHSTTILCLHSIQSSGLSLFCVDVSPPCNKCHMLKSITHIHTSLHIRDIMTSIHAITVRDRRRDGAQLCQTSAFSLINRLGNWVVVTFFFSCHHVHAVLAFRS
jgi:hypothetical protein